MTFFAFKVAWAILRPGNLAVLALLVGLATATWGGRFWRRLGQGMVAAVAAFFVALMFLPVGSWVTAPLEQRVAPAALPDRVDGIVILGGPIPVALQTIALNEAGERVLVGLQLARRFPEARVVYSGGSGLPFYQDDREADVAREIFASLGFAGPRFVFERDSRNTYENAVYTKELVDPKEGETWVLLTSAAHMPRSLLVFDAAGWPAMLPHPVDYRAEGFNDPISDTALAAELNLFEYGFREWVGIVAYRLRGWTDRFWPEAAAQPASG